MLNFGLEWVDCLRNGWGLYDDSQTSGAGVATLTRSPDSGFLMGMTVGSVATAFGYNGYGEVEWARSALVADTQSEDELECM